MNRKPSIVIIVLTAILTIGGVSAFRIAKHHRHAQSNACWHKHERCHATASEQNFTNPYEQGTCHTKP